MNVKKNLEHISNDLQKDLSKQSNKKTSKKSISQSKTKNFTDGLTDPEISTFISNRKLNGMFEPSMNMIRRIINSIAQGGTKTKTDLAVDAKLHYSMLVKHIIWMEKKGLVKSIVEKSKIKVDLTDKGKEFGSTIEKVMD